jgi:glutaredoxin
MIIYYSTGCPICIQVKALMDRKGIKYEYEGNEEVVEKIATENNIMTAPFAEVDGEFMNSVQFRKYINTL